MNGRAIFGLILTLVIVGGAVALGIGMYQAGLAAGVAQGGGTVVAPYPGVVGYGWHPFGFGLGFFGFLGTLLFIFLVFGLIRAVLFGGRGRGWGGPGRWGPGGPGDHDHGRWQSREQYFEDWHKRQHDAGATPESTDPGRESSG